MPHAVDVGSFPNRKTFMIDAWLHVADVITHDEENVRLRLRRGRCRHLLLRDRRSHYSRLAEAQGNCGRENGTANARLSSVLQLRFSVEGIWMGFMGTSCRVR